MNKTWIVSRLLFAATILAVGVLVFAFVAPTKAITWGIEDVDNIYSNVGSIVITLTDPLVTQWCTGTLIAPDVFLTAGHCTTRLESWQISGRLVSTNVSFSHENILDESTWLDVERIITHPLYGSTQYSNPHDVGLIILSEPIDYLPFANLPEEGFLDVLKQEGVLHEHQDKTLITVVGYGMTVEWPHTTVVDKGPARWYAYSQFQALTKPWLHMTQNHNLDLAGTCFGDSGGPAFIDYQGVRWLVGITSWGDGMCLTNGFDYRVDIAETLEFIAPYLEPAP